MLFVRRGQDGVELPGREEDQLPCVRYHVVTCPWEGNRIAVHVLAVVCEPNAAAAGGSGCIEHSGCEAFAARVVLVVVVARTLQTRITQHSVVAQRSAASHTRQ